MKADPIAQAYIHGLGLTAVYATGHVRSRKVAIRTGRVPPKSALAVRWCARPLHAEVIAAWIADVHIVGEEAGSAIEIAARACGLPALDSRTVQDQAAAIATAVETAFHAAREAGDLKAVNRQYVDYRRQATADGKPIMLYPHWIFALKKRVARSAGESNAMDLTLPLWTGVAMPDRSIAIAIPSESLPESECGKVDFQGRGPLKKTDVRKNI